MQIEKRNQKMVTALAVLVLFSIVLIIIAGFMIQEQTIASKDKSMSSISNTPLIDVRSAHSGQTGELMMSAGIILLFVGFGVVVVMLWAGRNSVQHPVP